MQVREQMAGSLAAPIGATEIWTSMGTSGIYEVRVMKLRAPDGYTCLGDAAVQGYNGHPDLNLFR